MFKTVFTVFSITAAGFFYSCKGPDSPGKQDYKGWSTYAGSKDGIRYSSNDQITPSNVSQLQVAWTFSTNDKNTGNRTQNQCSPVDRPRCIDTCTTHVYRIVKQQIIDGFF